MNDWLKTILIKIYRIRTNLVSKEKKWNLLKLNMKATTKIKCILFVQSHIPNRRLSGAVLITRKVVGTNRSISFILGEWYKKHDQSALPRKQLMRYKQQTDRPSV